jgi:solute carrier family 13 (sodium-dependent dicarboxylate transporter), member 2/3/5
LSEHFSTIPGQPKSLAQLAGLVLGPAILIAVVLTPAPEGLSFAGWVTVGILGLMAIWWVTEAIPIPITSLLPLVLFPVFGVAGIGPAASPYASPIVILLLGGFIIAKSVERWGLHERLALLTVAQAGSSPQGLIAGFLIASALLSGWISNTATAIMLMPVALSVAYALGAQRQAGSPLAVGLALAVAYGASIGGLMTPVGTPTNLIIIGAMETAGDDRLTFARWLTFGIPALLVLLPMAWLTLARLSGKIEAPARDVRHVITQRLSALGPWTTPEIRTIALFLVVAFFWVFRTAFLNDLTVFGVQPFAGLTDHVIAIAGAIAFFLVPSGSREERGSMLLDWPTAVKIPWDVVLLFGGGLSLAAQITASGLGDWLGMKLELLDVLPAFLLIMAITTFVVFATEVTSNVATASALTPVVLAMAVATGVDPAQFAIPIALAASCAFMFPMATAPNAIAFASGEVSIPRMAIIGFKLNILAIIGITLIAYVLTPMVLPTITP